MADLIRGISQVIQGILNSILAVIESIFALIRTLVSSVVDLFTGVISFLFQNLVPIAVIGAAVVAYSMYTQKTSSGRGLKKKM
ncbi:hypothetical protein RQP46_000976 [Phenoliferia psychrophenolica]